MNPFKVGDKVVCVDASGLSALKFGNIYEVISADEGYVGVISGSGLVNWYSYKRFKFKDKEEVENTVIPECTCSKNQIFNHGCNCGFIQKYDGESLWN